MKNSYLSSTIKQFYYYKMLAEKAMEQLQFEDLSWQYNMESNSIAVIVNHMAGNMRSRFTDFLTTDGEKPWRNRDMEFIHAFKTREELLDYWNHGWEQLFSALEKLKSSDLEEIVYIRNEGHTVVEALNRQLAHYPYHVGQIVFIARMRAGNNWKSLSIPRNQSQDYNADKFSQDKGVRHFTDNV